MNVQNLDKMNSFYLNLDLQTSCVSATQTILVSGNINCLNSLLLNASSFHSDKKSKIPSENCCVEKIYVLKNIALSFHGFENYFRLSN